MTTWACACDSATAILLLAPYLAIALVYTACVNYLGWPNLVAIILSAGVAYYAFWQTKHLMDGVDYGPVHLRGIRPAESGELPDFMQGQEVEIPTCPTAEPRKPAEPRRLLVDLPPVTETRYGEDGKEITPPIDDAEDAKTLIVRPEDQPAPIPSPTPSELAREIAEAQRLLDTVPCQWGDTQMPLRHSVLHYLYVGRTGTGKTSQMRILAESVFPHIGKGWNHRAVIYDGKGNMLQYLRGMEKGNDENRTLKCRYGTFNPLESRKAFALCWDIAGDASNDSDTREVAAILAPVDKDAREDNFFDKTARQILDAIMVFLNETAPGEWTLDDLVRIARAPQATLTRFLLTTSSHIVERYFLTERMTDGILATLEKHMGPLAIAAAQWSRLPRENRVSLKKWIESRDESILIFGTLERNRETSDPVYRAMFDLLAKLTISLAPSAKTPRRIWYFLDEIAEAGRLSMLVPLLTKGREYGASVVLGFQSKPRMDKVYGKEDADTIVENCTHVAIGGCQAETAKWAYELFQSYEAFEWDFSESGGTTSGSGPGGGSWSEYASWSRSQKLQQRDVIKASEFISMRQAGPENGIPAVYHTSLLGEKVFKHTIPWWWVKKHLHDPDETFPYIEPRHDSEQRLKKWEEADLERLGLRQLGITLDDMTISPEELERRLKLLGRGREDREDKEDGKQRKRIDFDSDFYKRVNFH